MAAHPVGKIRYLCHRNYHTCLVRIRCCPIQQRADHPRLLVGRTPVDATCVRHPLLCAPQPEWVCGTNYPIVG